MRCVVTSGAASIIASAAHATAYRTVAAAPRSSVSVTAAAAPISAPCQMKCTSAQPMDETMESVRGESATVLLLVVGEQQSNLPQLLRRCRLGGQRLHDELGRRAAKRAVQQVRDQALLRIFLREAGLVEVDASLFVADGDALFRHQLQQLERGGVGEIALFGQHVVDLTHGARAALPQDTQNRELRIGRLGNRLLFHGRWTASTIFFVASTKFFVASRRRARQDGSGCAADSRNRQYVVSGFSRTVRVRLKADTTYEGTSGLSTLIRDHLTGGASRD